MKYLIRTASVVFAPLLELALPRITEMKPVIRLLSFFLAIGLLVCYIGVNRGQPVKSVIEQKRPNLAAIFNSGNYTQYIDQFGTVARAVFDEASGLAHNLAPTGTALQTEWWLK
jgi:hypothetical protein